MGNAERLVRGMDAKCGELLSITSREEGIRVMVSRPPVQVQYCDAPCKRQLDGLKGFISNTKREHEQSLRPATLGEVQMGMSSEVI